MDPPSLSNEMENPPRGCLTFQDKIYPIYDGHNTIGRNPEATINIKNVNISQHHAIITVVSDNAHFISDLKSSNGTVVDNRKLNPLKLYTLNNGASVKFADVFCTYKKLKCGENVFKAQHATQDLSESFYGARTQTVVLEHSNEMNVEQGTTEETLPTLGIHEMATQVVNPQSVHEMKTQTVTFDESFLNDDGSSDSLDFITMQKASESQAFALKQQKNSEENADVKSKKIKSDSEASTPDFKSFIHPTDKQESDEETPASQICPVKTGCRNAIESDSNTEDDDVPSNLERRRSKYVISDDDETDIEDNDNKVNGGVVSEQQEVAGNLQKNHSQNQDPSFTDSFKLEVSENDKNTNEENDEETPAKKQEESNEVARSVIPEDHLYCQAFNNKENSTADSTMKTAEDEEKSTNDKASISKELLEDNEKQTSTAVAAAVAAEPAPYAHPAREEIGDADRSVIQTEEKNVQSSQTGDGLNEEIENLFENAAPTSVSEEPKEKESNNNEQNDIFDQATQQISYDFVNVGQTELKQNNPTTLSNEKENKTLENNDENHTEDKEKRKENDDDIYLQPTQELCTSDNRPSKFSLVDDDDDIYIQPTQEINDLRQISSKTKITENTPEESKGKSSFKDHDFLLPLPPLVPLRSSTSKNVSIPKLDDDDEDEMFLPPTQALEILHKDDQVRPPSEKNSDPKEVEDQLEMLFASQSDHRFVATQQLVDVLEDKKLCEDDIIDDSMMEGTSFSKWMSKKAQFHSIDSIREILDESMSDDEINKKKEKEIPTKKNEGEEKENSEEKTFKSEENLSAGGGKEAVKNVGKRKGKSVSVSRAEEKSESQSSIGSNDSKSSIKKDKLQSEEKTDLISETPNVSSRGKRAINRKIKEETNKVSDEKGTERRKSKRNTNSIAEPTQNSEEMSIDDTEKEKAQKKPIERNTRKSTKPDSQPKEETEQRITRSTKIQSEEKRTNIKQSKRKADSDVDVEEKPAKKDSEIDGDETDGDKKRKKKESSIASTASNDNKASETRKRTNSSEDEFQSKVQKTVSPKKPPGRPTKTKKQEEEEVVETPTTRRMSARCRKIKTDEEIISVSSSSSTVAEVISIPSSSSTPIATQPTKRGRKLSANSRALKNEESKKIQELSPILETPERSKRQQKPRVVFTMMDSPELESLIRQLGGTVVDTVDSCSVLVTGNVKRSLKLLKAVGQAKPICSPQWLKDCKKSFKFLDPWDYILVDKEAEKKWEFSLRESLERSLKRKLLENYTFQIMVTTAADVLKGAIEACGGKCVTRNLAKAGTDNLMIVATADQKTKFNKIVKDNPEVKVVEPEAIFDGTLRQEFRFNRHLLT